MRHILELLAILSFVLIGNLSASAEGVCDDDNVRERVCDPQQKSVYSRRLMNLQRLWLMMAVFDADERTATPAVVDIGFLDDGNVRTPGAECYVNYVPSKFADNVDCSANIYGEYEGLLLATGNDAYATHGNNMKNIVAATLNDGGAAGVAGQVAVPNLYRLDDVQSYLFELGPTIIQAVDDGSSVINISGGFPCIIQLNTPPNSQTPNICTNEGRWQFCQSAGMIGALPMLATMLCATTELEGDLVENIATAASYAAAAGVPIVASAGNISTEWLTSVVDLTSIINWTASNSDAADWGIIPATVGPVIAAGAANTSAPYANQDFHGPRVNIWAPFSDTSPAAAFVSGLIALAQAINPELSPTNDGLSPSELEALPQTLRDMLMDTAYTVDELAATCDPSEPDCMTDPTGERRNLVHPYRFLRTAAQGAIPNFESLGYADTFDSFADDHEPANDDWPDPALAPTTLLTAMTLPAPVNTTTTRPGTIFYVPGTPAKRDRDAYFVELSGSANAQVDHYLALTYLTDYGDLILTSPHDFLTLRETRMDGAQTSKIYDTPVFAQGASFPVKVAGQSATDDNLYKLSVVRGLNVRPNPDRFDRVGGNNNPLHPNSNNVATAATLLALNPQLPAANTATSRWGLSANELTIHSVDDNDHFTISVPAAPNDGLTYRKHLTLNIDNPMIRLKASIDGGTPQVVGDSGVYLHNDQAVTFFAEPRYKGLVLSYKLTGTLTLSPIEYDALPDKAFADLEHFLDRMRRHVDDRMPQQLGCVGCMRLQSDGLIQRVDGRHAVARYGRIPRNARSANYLILDKASRVTITLTDAGISGARLRLFDADGRPLARSSRRDPRLTMSLDAGAYLLVTTGGQRGDQQLRYAMRSEPQ